MVRLWDTWTHFEQQQQKWYLDAKCLTQIDFHKTVKWQGLNVNTTKTPGSWKEKQPVGKMCSLWSDTAAVTPSNTMLSFFWNNKLSKERRHVCSAVLVMGKTLAKSNGNWPSRWADPSPGNKVNSVLHVCASSENRLTLGLTATVRGPLAKGELASERPILIPNLPWYKLPQPLLSV